MGYGAAALGPRTHEKNKVELRDERSAAENMRRIEDNVRLLDGRIGAAPS